MDTVDVDVHDIVVDPTSTLSRSSSAASAATPPSSTQPAATPEEPGEAPRIPRQSTGDDRLVVAEGLTERELRMLAFERQWWKHAGAKEQAIRDVFEVSSTRYYQLLNALLDEPAALEHDPVLVARLRRLRATRSRARTGGRRR
jgi:Protein of unknown function (DUF3263)